MSASKQSFLAVLLAASAAGCGGTSSTDVDSGGLAPGADAGQQTGEDTGTVGPGADASVVQLTADDLLRQSDVVAACAKYKADHAAHPADSHAAFGATLSCAVLLPDTAPVTDLLDSCGQKHLDVARQIFGSTGAFAQGKVENAARREAERAEQAILTSPLLDTEPEEHGREQQAPRCASGGDGRGTGCAGTVQGVSSTTAYTIAAASGAVKAACWGQRGI